MSSRSVALEPAPRQRLRGRRSLTTSGLLTAVALPIVIAIGVVEPLVLPLIGGVTLAVLAGSGMARARGDAERARRADRLEAELSSTIHELRRSRARVAHVADAERRRIERDLHDGCQQRLIALRVKLALAEEIVGAEDHAARELIKEIAADAETALEELHAMVHGIYPSLLIDRGVADAVRALARDAPLPVRTLVDGVRRYRPDVEAAVYFACAEALQNTAKHGGPGASARIMVRHDSTGLVFEVRDDGHGYDTGAPAGSGLANMEDRLAAVSGRVNIVSTPSCGTLVQGWVPAAALDA